MLLVNRKWRHASAVGRRARKRLCFSHFKAFFCSLSQFPMMIRRRRNAGVPWLSWFAIRSHKLRLLCLSRNDIMSEFRENGRLTFKLQ
jgi:hypothetical protein